MTDILAFDPARTTNARLMVDCARLGYLVDVVVDVTYNAGRFWREHPAPALRFDIDPQWDAQVADFRDLPLERESVATVVLDPPYKLNGTSTGIGPSALDHGYGVAGAYSSVDTTHNLIRAGIDEAWRVLAPGGLLLLKCQAQQNAARMNDQPGMFAQYAIDTGHWHDEDRLHVVTTPRKQPRAQCSARANYSTLVVLRARRTRTDRAQNALDFDTKREN